VPLRGSPIHVLKRRRVMSTKEALEQTNIELLLLLLFNGGGGGSSRSGACPEEQELLTIQRTPELVLTITKPHGGSPASFSICRAGSGGGMTMATQTLFIFGHYNHPQEKAWIKPNYGVQHARRVLHVGCKSWSLTHWCHLSRTRGADNPANSELLLASKEPHGGRGPGGRNFP
jgi:hypothetical protein